jgi:hypothetical protein
VALCVKAHIQELTRTADKPGVPIRYICLVDLSEGEEVPDDYVLHAGVTYELSLVVMPLHEDENKILEDPDSLGFYALACFDGWT